MAPSHSRRPRAPATTHGFRIDTIDECEPDASLFDGRLDELARRRRVPVVLLIAAGVDG
ncbi:MAG: hypothetical protein R2697_09840 [Ilumatobacteraceae bacterium]